MKKKLAFIFLAFLLNTAFINRIWAQAVATAGYGSAQLPKEPISVPSPNVAGLGLYGEIPVSYFTGIPQIEIPLYTLKEREISMPISLSYHASGFRPDQHPGWVGQGWTLNVGGVITRQINGMPDDQDVPPDYSGGPALYKQTGYYYTPSVNSNITSTTLAYDAQHYESYGDPVYHKDTAPDEFSFNFNGYSGKFYLDPNGNWKVKCDKPVKVIFNNHFIPVPFKRPQQSSNAYSTPIGEYMQTFSGFTIITEDGTQYIFGGDATSDNNAIEYNIPLFDQNDAQWVATSWYLVKVISKNGYETVNLTYQRDSFIDQMYLNANLDLGTTGTGSTTTSGVDCSQSGFNAVNFITGKLISPVYLTSITTKNFSATFIRCSSNELAYPQIFYYNFWHSFNRNTGWIPYPMFNTNAYSSSGSCYVNDSQPPSIQPAYTSPPASGGSDNYPNSLQNLQWKQLNYVYINDNVKGVIKRFSFNYSNDANIRLTLNSITESSADGTSKPPYLFQYYPAPATTGGTGNPEFVERYDPTNPAQTYTSQTDHWGFWNGTDASIPGPSNTSGLINYYNYKQPNFNYALAYTLQEIKYPTGGVTDFTYEPNYYSRQLNLVRSSGCSAPSSTPLMAGGIRIKSIVSYDPAIPSSKVEKDYYYVTNYDNSYSSNPSGFVSSGTLGGQFQYYFDNYQIPSFNGNASYSKKVFSTQSQLPSSYNSLGTHIGYSEVTEKRSDGSYTKFFYSNFDNVNDAGHLDEATQVLQTSRTAYEPFTSLDEERGKLLKEEFHNSTNPASKPVKTVTYQYVALNKTNEYVPSIQASAWKVCPSDASKGAISVQDGALYKFYTYSYLLSSKVTQTFDVNGNNPVTSTENYAYDNPLHRQVTRLYTTDGKGATLTTINVYPQDYGNASDFIAQMKAINNIGTPIETVTLRSPVTGPFSLNAISGKLSEYPLATGDYPVKTYSLDLSKPLPIGTTAGANNFVLSNGATVPFAANSPMTLPSSSSYNKDSHYRQETAISYDMEKVKTFAFRVAATTPSQAGGIPLNMPVTYIWDAGRRYPVAHVKNASCPQIAFTDFEDPGNEAYTDTLKNPGGWIVPSSVGTSVAQNTGNNSGLITSSTTISTIRQIPAGTYIVSYWSKVNQAAAVSNSTASTIVQPGANTWYYVEHTVTLASAAQITITGNTSGQYIDGLRLYPAGAMMTTYTYTPLVGITSMTDARGQITYYDYDSFQRLVNIRNKDGDVIKHYSYNYAH